MVNVIALFPSFQGSFGGSLVVFRPRLAEQGTFPCHLAVNLLKAGMGGRDRGGSQVISVGMDKSWRTESMSGRGNLSFEI